MRIGATWVLYAENWSILNSWLLISDETLDDGFMIYWCFWHVIMFTQSWSYWVLNRLGKMGDNWALNLEYSKSSNSEFQLSAQLVNFSYSIIEHSKSLNSECHLSTQYHKFFTTDWVVNLSECSIVGIFNVVLSTQYL